MTQGNRLVQYQAIRVESRGRAQEFMGGPILGQNVFGLSFISVVDTTHPSGLRAVWSQCMVDGKVEDAEITATLFPGI
jgi:hypothetical protein